MEVEVKTAAAFYRTLVENSRGITMVGGFTFAVGGIVAFSVQSRDAIEHNKALVAKDVEILESKLEAQKQQTELASLKNLLLFGQSEEYKSMRQSFSSREIVGVAADKKD